MAILITGGTGFIGLNLIEALLAAGETVVCFSAEPVPEAFLRQVPQWKDSLVSIVGDVRNYDELVSALRHYNVRGMYPLAAVTADEKRETSDPETVWAVNTQALITQLRAARDCGVARIVVPASGAVYGESYYRYAVADEIHTPCDPIDIYGISKFAAERLALRLGKLWQLNLCVARIGGTFGPWERVTGVRDLITPFFHTAQLALDGGKAVLPRDIPDVSWCYSRDIASGLIHLYHNAPAGYVANISSGIGWGTAIVQFADQLKRRFPNFFWEQSSNPDEQNIRFSDHRTRARMNISRMQAIGWRPAFPPGAAIDDYVAWLERSNALKTASGA